MAELFLEKALCVSFVCVFFCVSLLFLHGVVCVDKTMFESLLKTIRTVKYDINYILFFYTILEGVSSYMEVGKDVRPEWTLFHAGLEIYLSESLLCSNI